MHTVAAMRADFDSTFPDLNDLPKGADRVPGRPLGELIVRGLRERGFDTSDLQDEEPFFVTKCKAGDYRYVISAYLLYSEDESPAWMVSCTPALGFWGRLFGKTEDKEIGMVLDAIHDTLRSDGRIRDLRWYPDAPFYPFSEAAYAETPKSVLHSGSRKG